MSQCRLPASARERAVSGEYIAGGAILASGPLAIASAQTATAEHYATLLFQSKISTTVILQ